MSLPDVVFEDFSNICRLCLNRGDLRYIFSDDVINVLVELAHLQVIQNDDLPQNICGLCRRQLENTSNFIENCKKTDVVLRNVVKQKKAGLKRNDQPELSWEAEPKEEAESQCKYKMENSKMEVKILKESNCDNSDDDGEVNSSGEDEKKNFSSEKTLKFPCKYCGKVYVRRKRLQTHLKIHKMTAASAAQKQRSPEDGARIIGSDGSVTCENCSENFNTINELVNHYNEFFNCRPKNYTSPTMEITNIVDFLKLIKKKEDAQIDEEPSGGQYSEEYVNGRKLKGTRRFRCNYCGKKYTRKNGLERHILSHTGVKPFKCTECGKRYTTKDTLKTHFLTHTGVKAHKCETCHKSFTQSSHLSYHMRRHAGEKPFICTFCGKAFLSNYHLERHNLMHTGVKPYTCHVCGKQFVRSTTLRDHLLIHTGEKPFQCQHCGKQFNRKQSLTIHMLYHNDPKKSKEDHYGGGGGGLYEGVNIPNLPGMSNGSIQTL